MWTQIIKLLEIKHKSYEEADEFDRNLPDLNDWIRREYRASQLTCEELERAYNALVKEELTKSDGRIIEAYPFLDTRHVGEVIAAYRRLVNSSSEVNQVLSTGKYLPEPTELPDAEQQAQIDAKMERYLQEAINVTSHGVNYYDLNNGLYTWLFKKGRINPSQTEWEEALILAKAWVLQSLAYQKELVGKLQGWGPDEDLRVHGYQPLVGVIKNRLADAINQTGDYPKAVRKEAYRICLSKWLRRRAGCTEQPTGHLITTPVVVPPENSGPKPFSHKAYIQSLTEQLPTMGDEAVSNLQRQARTLNVLDVYELTTAEWNRRQAPVKSNSFPKSASKPTHHVRNSQ